MLGTKQTGDIGYRIADLARDAGLLPDVIALADTLTSEYPVNAELLVERWIGGATRFAHA